jgi:GT2 family glycosyltransferase
LPKLPSVLVVIVNYNHAKCLEDLMTSVLATKYPNFQVVFIDNASTDKSRELMKTFNDQRLKKILLSENLGLCKARNLGASHEESCYFAFLDPDVTVTQMWLQRLVDTLESDPSVGIAESNILSQIPWAASSMERVKLYALGAAFIVRNKLWHKLGGFDDDYFVGYDDQDLGWRTWLLGYKVVGVSDSVVYHVGALLRKGKGNRLFRYHDFKNRLSSFIKNFEPLTFLHEMPRIIFAMAAFCFEDFKHGQFDGILIAFWILKNLRKLLQKRSSIQDSRRIKDRDVKPLWDPTVRGSLRRSGRFLW